MKNKVIAIVGPTGVGKTRVAIEMAGILNAPVISADSRQIYREMKIGTARPSEKELSRATHYFIGNISIHDDYSAARYEKEALELLDELFKETDTVIVAGGSGLYLKALFEGLDDIPAVNPDVRQKYNRIFSEEGLNKLQDILREKDPEAFGNIETDNPRRVIRALEVLESTGNSLMYYWKKKKAIERDFEVIKVGLKLPREKLYQRINSRCKKMLEEGLLQEVKELLPNKDLVPLQTVGYSEYFDYLSGRTTMEKATELFMQHTRNYAKRQMTWFGKDKDVRWFSPETSVEEILRSLDFPV